MMGTEQARPHRQGAGRVRAVVDDLGTELVSEHTIGVRIERRHAHRAHEAGEVGEIRQGVEVRPADARSQRAHDHVPGGGHRLGDVVDDQPAASGHRGPHGLDPVPMDLHPRRARPPASSLRFAR